MGERMYNSLHRHPKAIISPMEWYDDTDATIEADLACEYWDWIYHQWLEASKIDDIDHLKMTLIYGRSWFESAKEAKNADQVTFDEGGKYAGYDPESVPMDWNWTIGWAWDAEIKIREGCDEGGKEFYSRACARNEEGN